MDKKEKRSTYAAKTMLGLENVLAKELADCGASDIKAGHRIVTFSGTKETLYKANYLCRTALRILCPILDFKITTQKQLYKKAFSIPWEKFFTVDQTFATFATVNNSLFTHSKYASLLLKDAIADRFRKKFYKRPFVNPQFPDVSIDLHISNNHVTISLDSSGKSLHKRGYKKATGVAPLNEVMAAGMILLSGWDKKTDFYDPMCGSGTIIIEAAMIAQNIPAGFFREMYGFKNWKDFDPALWKKVVQDASDQFRELECGIFGSDESNRMVKVAIENAKQAHLNRDVSIKRRDFFKLQPDSEKGMLITNPPYDQRIDSDDIDQFYKNIGDALKNNFQGFTAWILSGNLSAIKKIGLKSEKRIIMYNGPIESRFSKYELYAGSKRIRKPEEESKEVE